MGNLIRFFVLVFLSFSCEKGNNGGDNKPPIPDVSQYINPIFEPVLADPTVFDNRAVDGYFYSYGTQDNWGTSLETEHIVPILRSTDLVDWEYIGDAFDEQPQWNSPENLIWAPDIVYRGGKYYLYYSLSVWNATNSAIGVAVSDTPDSKFMDLGKILDSNSSGVNNSIDPYLFTEDNGELYLVWGSFHGIYGVPIEEDGVTARLEEKFKIAGNSFEAPYIFKKNGYYYFMGSVGSCCDGVNSTYHVTVARSKLLRGPYLDINGTDIINANDWNYGDNGDFGNNMTVLKSSRNWVGPGHHSQIITDENESEWILYHAIKRTDPRMPNGAPKRPLMLDKVNWDENGWLKIGHGSPSEYNTDSPIWD